MAKNKEVIEQDVVEKEVIQEEVYVPMSENDIWNLDTYLYSLDNEVYALPDIEGIKDEFYRDYDKNTEDQSQQQVVKKFEEYSDEIESYVRFGTIENNRVDTGLMGETISDELCKIEIGEEYHIDKLGSFTKKEMDEREATDRKGNKIIIPKSKYVDFTMSDVFEKRLNGVDDNE